MNKTTETIADIVREIREASKASIDSGIATCDADERSVGEELLGYADRIEAAVKVSEKPNNSTTCGNAAALREALERWLVWDANHGHAYTVPCNATEAQPNTAWAEHCMLLNAAHSALAALARNCDLYATAEEAWEAFCDDTDVQAAYRLREFGPWLFAPAEGGAEMTPDPKTCRWLDRYFGDVCRRKPGVIQTPLGTLTLCTEPPCRPCADCGHEPITPETPAWDDVGEGGNHE